MVWRWPFCARKRTVPTERFFYHSFPPRGRSTDSEIEKGCKILSLIGEAGLVLYHLTRPLTLWGLPICLRCDSLTLARFGRGRS